MNQETQGVSPWAYLLGGAAIGDWTKTRTEQAKV
jgi:hypothetical protein